MSEAQNTNTGCALDAINSEQLVAELPDFRPGDTLRVHTLIVEGNKERIQVFAGIVVQRKGKELSASFTVRKTSSNNVWVERIFMLHSPNIADIKLERRGKVRRAKLYYLRDRQGKSARIKEKREKIQVG